MTVRLGLAAAAAILVADQALKAWALGLPIESYAPLAGSGGLGLGVTHMLNPGVVFGMIHPDADYRRLALVVLVASIAGLLLVRMLRSRRVLLNLARGAVVGGALSNLADRVRLGGVVDYLVLHSGRRVWFVFNLADLAIVAGALLLFAGAAVYALAARTRA